MKRLRILTGRHAGTSLVLAPSTYGISSDADADIRITDWSDAPLVLELKTEIDNMCTATLRRNETGDAIALVDFSPRKFAAIAMCIGPEEDSEWPDDMELLSRLLAPPSAAVIEVAPEAGLPPAAMATPAQRWQRRLVWIGAASAVSLGAAFTVVVHDAANRAQAAAPMSLLQQARLAIDRSGVSGVSARASVNRVVVEGIVPSPADVSRLRMALGALPPGSVDHRYAAASDIAQSIAEALGAPGITVRQVAPGDFSVEGKAVYAGQLQVAADRLVNDLAPLVRSIRVSVADLPPPQKMPMGAMLETSGLEYVQTRDGTKHLSLLTQPVEELKDSPDGIHNHSARTDTQPRSDK